MRRLAAHRPVFAVERPQNELLGAGGGEVVAVRGPGQRAHARRIARHAHVLAVGDAPAVQRRLLHHGDHEAAVRADGDAEMRALPFELLRGGAGGVGKPERAAVVMRDGQAEAFRRKRQPGDRRGRFECALLAFAGEHMRGLAGRPGDRAVRRRAPPDRPSVSCRRSRDVDARHQPVVATTVPSSPPVTMRVAVGGAGEDGALVHGDAALAAVAGEQQRLLAQHEHRRVFEEMHADHRAAGIDGADAVGERGQRGGGVGHAGAFTVLPSPAEAGGRERSASARSGFTRERNEPTRLPLEPGSHPHL